jgi:hypothetical protein
MSIDDHIELVNVLIARSGPNTAAAAWQPKLQALAHFLAEQKRLATPIPRDLGDLSDLPDELLKELSVKKTDELDDQILTVMRACDAGLEVNLDQILVGLYRKFHVVQTRRFLQNKLYRMYKKDLVFPVRGRRAYSLERQPEDERVSATDRAVTIADLDDEIPF